MRLVTFIEPSSAQTHVVDVCLALYNGVMASLAYWGVWAPLSPWAPLTWTRPNRVQDAPCTSIIATEGT